METHFSDDYKLQVSILRRFFDTEFFISETFSGVAASNSLHLLTVESEVNQDCLCASQGL